MGSILLLILEILYLQDCVVKLINRLIVKDGVFPVAGVRVLDQEQAVINVGQSLSKMSFSAIFSANRTIFIYLFFYDAESKLSIINC